MPHLRAAEHNHGGLVRAVLAERKAAAKETGGRRPGLMSGKGGMPRSSTRSSRGSHRDDVEISGREGDGLRASSTAATPTLAPASSTASRLTHAS